jgi:hypothetical protein
VAVHRICIFGFSIKLFLFRVYPPCDNTRRLVQITKVVTDPDEFVRLCHEEEDAVLATISGNVSDVSESCNKLLQKNVEVACSYLAEESPVFIPAVSSSMRVQGTILFLVAVLAGAFVL